MAGNKLNHTDAIDILDPNLFQIETNIGLIEVYSQVGGDTRRKMLGQQVANEAIRVGSIGTLTELDGATTANTVSPDDFVVVEDTSTVTNKKVKVSALGGAGISTYNLLSNKLTVTGTAGITATLAGGVVSIIVPAGGAFSGGSFKFDVADATYTSAAASNAVKISVNNSSNGITILRQYSGTVYSNTNTTIDANNPVTINTALTFNQVIEQYGAGITSFVVPNIPTNASAGGFIVIK